MLHIENLHTHYGPIEALKGIDLDIHEGEIVTLIGANGAGKSTLLNTICGSPRASVGKIEYRGENLTRVPTHKISQRGIALVPEGRRIFPALTIEENLELGGFHQTKAENQKSLEHIYQLFPRLLERRSQRAGTLSGGEQQMLAIGRGLMMKPKLLLLDEPTNDLDVETLSSLENALLEFPGCAVVITHDRWFLDRVATHILAYEGTEEDPAKWFWFEGNFEGYEANKIDRLGPEAARPHRLTYRKLTRG